MDDAQRPITVKPATYLSLGVALFLIKFLLDRLVAGAFGRGWSFMNYLIPGEIFSLPSIPQEERPFYLSMFALAIPFIWIGIWLTAWRLRDAGLPRWLMVLFFVPAINLVFFTVLGFWPSRRSAADRSHEPLAIEVVALRPVAAFLLAATSGAISAALCVTVAVILFRSYGWGAFVAAPFVGGMASAWIYGFHRPRDLSESLSVACVSMLLAGAGLLIIAIEGLVCLLMATPLALPVALLGGSVGHVLAHDRHRRAGRTGRGFEVLPSLFIPLLITGGEASQPREPPIHRVTTSVVINAPAADVWRHVVGFPQLPAPGHWAFRTGVAYPVSARIEGAGVGAIRYCQFSTGAFVEPITRWQPPSGASEGLLQFDVTDSPPPLVEWSWTGIEPPHLDNFLVSHRGQFRIVPLPDGRTRLEGTTWYSHAIHPDLYWRPWSDWIIGRIHVEVLDHIRNLAEARVYQPPLAAGQD